MEILIGQGMPLGSNSHIQTSSNSVPHRHNLVSNFIDDVGGTQTQDPSTERSPDAAGICSRPRMHASSGGGCVDDVMRCSEHNDVSAGSAVYVS